MLCFSIGQSRGEGFLYSLLTRAIQMMAAQSRKAATGLLFLALLLGSCAARPGLSAAGRHSSSRKLYLYLASTRCALLSQHSRADGRFLLQRAQMGLILLIYSGRAEICSSSISGEPYGDALSLFPSACVTRYPKLLQGLSDCHKDALSSPALLC